MRDRAQVEQELALANARFNDQMNAAATLRQAADRLQEETDAARIRAAETWGRVGALEDELEALEVTE